MEAIFKIEPTEFNQKLFQNIKKMFEGKNVTITISTEFDETDYLNANQANRKHLLENLAQEPTVRFTPEEFDRHVEKLLKDS
ncbi:hypothetical protein SAMN05444280_11971 [Tangfeifania diversioriginum]|uniref:Uncharacterized protein n=1 Tax=Tangfeifania diversioriginum TaxID=1168035 RepID=A0A1M6JB72_9BACT|nr:hypothetical protein [Tangfeifania diversioriginum]SHJ43921.1 hypothetical protein SAMN05444280_11971 [Tangfeifania diversioriginum]